MGDQNDNHLSLVQKHSNNGEVNRTLMKPQFPSQADFATYPCSTKSSTDTQLVSQSRSQRHPSISITTTSRLRFSALMLPASGNVGRFHSSHLPGETRTRSEPTPSQRLAMCSSKAKRSCRLHLWEELPEECLLGHHRHRIPTRFPGSGACLHSCKTKRAPRASTAQQLYWIFSAEPEPQDFQAEKSLPEFTHTQRGQGLLAYRLQFANR